MKPRLKTFCLGALYCLVLFIVTEVCLRLSGYKVQPRYINTEVITPNSAYRPDTLLGYQNSVGTYQRTNGKLSWSATNLTDESRKCSKTDTDQNKAKTFIFGCSNIYGIGLNDEQTFPWKLQEKMPEMKVSNFSTGGYNLLDHYLLLKRKMDNGEKCDVAIVTYGSYYDERIVLARRWRESQYRGLKHSPYLDSIDLPKATVKSDSLIITHTKLRYLENPLIYYSAAFNLINQVYNMADLYFSDGESCSDMIADNIIRLARANNIRLVFLIYSRDAETQRFISRLEKNKIGYIDGYLENPAHKYDLYPLDAHPNELANDSISQRVAAYFLNNKVL